MPNSLVYVSLLTPMLGNFSSFFYLFADFLKKYFFQKNLSGTLSECETINILIQIKTYVVLVQIWVQTVCKGNKQPKSPR